MTAGQGRHGQFGPAPGARVRTPQGRDAILDQQLMPVASRGGRVGQAIGLLTQAVAARVGCGLPFAGKIYGSNSHDRSQVNARLSAGFGTHNVKAGLFVEQDMRVQIRVLAVASVIGAAALGAVPAVATSGLTNAVAGCGAGYYENSDGQCIPDPSSGLPPGGAPGLVGGGAPPAGATAICRDGDYSFSTHHSGTCSRHGGVRQWLAN
jgi:hypothetical protein